MRDMIQGYFLHDVSTKTKDNALTVIMRTSVVGKKPMRKAIYGLFKAKPGRINFEP